MQAIRDWICSTEPMGTILPAVQSRPGSQWLFRSEI